MDILIRNINSNSIQKIDKMAKELKVSRSEFLADKIEEFAFKNEINELEIKYQFLVEKLIETMKEHINIIGSFMNEYLIDGEDVYNIYKFSEIVNEINCTKTDLDYYETKTSNLKINKVPIDVFDRINEISKEKKLSTNDFLNLYLRQLTYSNKLKLVDEKYKYSIEKTLGILDFSNRILQVFKDENIINISNEL